MAFNVTAALDKTAYNEGDVMTVTISGGDVTTTTGQTPSGTLTLTITDPTNQTTTTITVPPALITKTITSNNSVVITAVADDSDRVWTIDGGGLFATATA